MSYILDALKKAEAERHLGGVPSIHAAAPGSATAGDTPPLWRRHLPWLITGALALILLAYVLWSQPWHHAAPAVVPAPMVAVAPAAPVALPPVAVHEALPPVPVHEAQPPALPAPAVVKEKPTVTPVEAPKPAASTTPATPASPPEDEAGTVADLPANIQRELPPVSVNGYIYAKNPADRSALINKKLLHEGDNVAPDLVLEKLTPKGAVLNYKGYRYRVSY